MTARTRSKSQYWVFTVNHEPRAFWATLAEKFEEHRSHIQYVCGQLEEGDETEHLHFQGHIQLNRAQAMSWLKSNLNNGAHYEIMRGSTLQAKQYCQKKDGTEVPDTFIEFGEFKEKGRGAGKRNDIINLRDAIIKDHKTDRDIIENDELVESFAKYTRFADRVRMLYKPEERENGVEVILLVGEPGAGKTREAFRRFPDLFEVPISNGTLWLDGYDDHKHVLFDDFIGAGSKMSLDNTLKFFDRYVRKVPIKGSHTWYRPEVIIVTSNYHPRAWYKWENREKSWLALSRRFTEVHVFFRDSEPEEQVPLDYLEDVDQWPVQCYNEEEMRN